MNTVSGSSSFSTSGGAGSHGLSGLASGIDTESMVESMLAGTQGKIDKAEAEKQVTIWRQEMYRKIISDISSFQSSFFGSNSSTNLLSSDFFNLMSAVTESKAFSVLATTGASAGKTNVQVAQVATSAKVQSGKPVSGTLDGKMDLSALERRVVFKVGDKEVEVQLEVDSTKTPEEQRTSLATQINDKFTAEGITDITAAVDADGKLTIEGGAVSVSSKSSSRGLETLGLSVGKKSVDDKLTSTVKPDAAVSFTMSLNGLTRTITLDGVEKDANLTDAKLQEAMQSRINNAFGSGWVTVGVDQGKFTMKANGAGNIVSIGGDKSGLTLLGVKQGQSNKISNGQMLKNVSFGQALEGDNYRFSINGVEFSFTGDSTLSEIVKKVNASTAGVRMTYNDIEDKFTLEATSTGAGHSIRMEQSEGNLLNSLFGNVAGTGKTSSSDKMGTNSISGSTDFGGDATEFGEGYFRFTMDGVAHSVYVPAKASGKYTRDEVMGLINEGLADQFGYVDKDNTASVTDDIQAVQIVKNAGDNTGYSFQINNGSKVSFADMVPDHEGDAKNDALDVIAKGAGLQAAFGFNDTSNALSDTSKTLGDIGIKSGGEIKIGGETFAYTNGTSVQDLLDSINAKTGNTGVTASFADGRISLTGETAGTTVGVTGDLTDVFGGSSLQLGGAQGGAAKSAEGQNAIVNVNGVTVQRSSNTFTVNGLTLSLSDTNAEVENKRMQRVGDTWVDEAKNVYTVDANNNILSVTDASGNAVDASAWGGKMIDGNGYLSEDGTLTIKGEAATVTTTRNTKQIFDGLKSFVDKYNSMIETLNGLTGAKATYKDYPPLTSAQKKEMSENEIKLWEEKAKVGLLRKDDDLNSFLGSMRSILYTQPAGSDYSLYQVGIETSDEWKDKGKLIIDESKLKEMIESNPQALQELFAGAEDGLGTLLNKAIDKVASSSSGSPGSLVALAGVAGKATSVTNTMTKRLITINSRIDDLKKKYEKEKSRYWRQFTTMETSLSNLNTQSNWLTQQLG